MKSINFRNDERDHQFKKEEAAALEKLKRRCTEDTIFYRKENDVVINPEHMDRGLVHNENCPQAKSLVNQGKQPY